MRSVHGVTEDDFHSSNKRPSVAVRDATFAAERDGWNTKYGSKKRSGSNRNKNRIGWKDQECSGQNGEDVITDTEDDDADDKNYDIDPTTTKTQTRRRTKNKML